MIEAGARWLVFVVTIALPVWADGALVWEMRKIDVEAWANEREVVAQYRFRNVGTAPVRIVDLVTSCDCTTMELSKRTYRPGEEGTMIVRSSIGNRTGAQENTIGVITDEVGVEPAVLQLRANIRSLVTLSPRVLSWKRGAEPEEQAVEVAAAGALRIASLAIGGTYPTEAAETRVETIEEGAQYRVSVRPRSWGRTMNLTVSCTATFEDGTTQDFVIYGMARK